MEIVKATPEDRENIISLYSKYGFALEQQKWFDWKYYQNPTGDALQFKIIEGERLIGAVAIIPQIFIYKGEKITGLQTVDGLLGSEIRGKGFFNELMAFLTQQVPDYVTGKYFYFSFPSLTASIKAHENAGWHRLCDFDLKTCFLKPDPFFHKFEALKFLRFALYPVCSIFRKKLFSAGNSDISILPCKNLKDHSNKYESSEQISGDRSEQFLKWRVQTNPRDKIQIYDINDQDTLVGYIVCKIEKTSAEIVEINCQNLKKEYIYSFLKYVYQNKLAHSVDFWDLNDQFKNKLPLFFTFKRNFTGACFVSNLKAAGLPKGLNNWNITYLDSDW